MKYLSRITDFICGFVLLQPPWPDCDNNFVIMFKVGEGATPCIPETLSEEGQDFLLCCFLHDPYERHTANQLMDHSFVKVQLSSEVQPPLSNHLKCQAYVVAYGRCSLANFVLFFPVISTIIYALTFFEDMNRKYNNVDVSNDRSNSIIF